MAHAKTVEDYQERLERLCADDDPLVEAVRGAGTGWSGDEAWVRAYGRLSPGDECYCTLTYVEGLARRRACLVELYDPASPPAPMPGCIDRRDRHLGWIRMMPCTSDPWLPTLGAVLAWSQRYEILRYRPYRRCTLSAERNGEPMIVKVFADDRGREIHAAAATLWRAAVRGELDFAVARPIAWDPDARCLRQSLVVGRPVADHLFGDDGLEIASRMGRACASIPFARVVPPGRSSAAGRLARAREKASIAAGIAPSLAADVEAFTRALTRRLLDVRHGDPRPIHGAPHTHQWLVSEDGLGLVDFDGFTLGDPELDAAAFVGELDFERHTRVPVAELTAAFLEGYDRRAGRLDRGLLDFYRAERRFAKVCRTLLAARPGRVQAAARHLGHALACLTAGAG